MAVKEIILPRIHAQNKNIKSSVPHGDLLWINYNMCAGLGQGRGKVLGNASQPTVMLNRHIYKMIK